MGGAGSRLGKRLLAGRTYAPDDMPCRVGDVVLHEDHVWLVHSAAPHGRLVLDRVTQDSSRDLRPVDPLYCAYVMAARLSWLAVAEDYSHWRALFGATLGHYTDVLDDAALLERVLADDGALAARLDRARTLSDPFIRDARLAQVRMCAAATVLRRTPIAELRTARASQRYRNAGGGGSIQ